MPSDDRKAAMCPCKKMINRSQTEPATRKQKIV